MNKFATRKRNIFDPKSTKPFELSRTKIELFITCPRCFYLDRRLGVSPLRGPSFNINEAIDILFKKEFDIYRKKQEVHPLVASEGLSLVPYQHTDLDIWRNPFEGVRHHHEESNFIVFGGIDDIWSDDTETLSVVDYKATSKDGEISLDAEWQNSYKRQLEVYQWLFRNNGFSVSSIGYFVYTNGDRTKESFKDTLNFKTKLISYDGNTDWIDSTLIKAKETLSSDSIPNAGRYCDLCKYRDASGNSFRQHLGK